METLNLTQDSGPPTASPASTEPLPHPPSLHVRWEELRGDGGLGDPETPMALGALVYCLFPPTASWSFPPEVSSLSVIHSTPG